MLIPVKAFGAAKARLTGTLQPRQRAELARWMATRVVHAVAPAPTFVACDDDDVAGWAESLGATVLWGPGLGLNGAIDEGVATVAGKGFDHVLITHGDLPLPRSLGPLAGGSHAGRIVLIPDRHGDGTNVCHRPCGIHLPASYGGGSFRRHLAAALTAGVPVTVRYDTELSIDLDTATDLSHPLVAPVVREMLTP